MWIALALPAPPVLPRPRYTLADLARQTTERGFVVPVLVLAATTGMLGVAVGSLPLLGTRLGLDAVLSAAPVAVLALVSAAKWATRADLCSSAPSGPRHPSPPASACSP
nr:hypothetical protein [Microbacterium bovistercoris]